MVAVGLDGNRLSWSGASVGGRMALVIGQGRVGLELQPLRPLLVGSSPSQGCSHVKHLHGVGA